MVETKIQMEKRSSRAFRESREAVGLLLKHFRALIDGRKELKLHRQQRNEFLSQDIEETSKTVMRHRISAVTSYSIAENWGEILIFLVIGLLLFAFASLPLLRHRRPPHQARLRAAPTG